MKMGQNLLEKYIDENKKLPLTLKMDELFWKLVLLPTDITIANGL